MSPVEVSVIIPFHGDKSHLDACLQGLRNQACSFSFEVIVVENGNSHEIKRLNDLNPEAIFISLDRKIPPGKARNMGVGKSKSDLLAFIDGDCVPEAAWLSQIHSSLKNGNQIVIGPVVNLFPFHPIASIDNLLLFPDCQKHRSSSNIEHFPGCNFGITKKLFLITGGFREDIEIGEDTKFSQSALKQATSKVFFNPHMVVRHRGRKNFINFMRHHKDFGYHRQYFSRTNCHENNRFQKSYLYSALFGIRRLLYILLRTLQWNPLGFFRVILYFPILLVGLFAWGKGFYKQNQRCLEDQN